MKKPSLFFIAMAICFSSCYPERTSYQIFTESYVLAYYDIDDIPLISYDPGTIILNIGYYGGLIYSTKNKPVEFRSLCEKHGDTTFNRKIQIHIGREPNRYMLQDFVKIEILSDKDFDMDHPAGSSLGDIACFFSTSPFKYIESGYKTQFDWMNYELLDIFDQLHNISTSIGHFSLGRECLYPVIGKVDDLKPSDLRLLGKGEISWGGHDSFAMIKFLAEPQTEKLHNITVTLTDDRGSVYLAVRNLFYLYRYGHRVRIFYNPIKRWSHGIGGTRIK